MAYLSIRNVAKTFTGRRNNYHALREINLDIEQGEFVCLIGHSGCGKTTLLNLISGLEAPSSGILTLEEQVIRGPGPDRGMVFQHHALLPWLSVHDNVYEAVRAVFPDNYDNEVRTRVHRFLNLAGLSEHQSKRPAELSGGMKQRVAIARAFAVEPKVLLLDEPFGALDALTKARMHEELLHLWQMDRSSETVVMVTHDIDEAVFLADRVVVMTNGPAATIREVVDVRISRPRDKRALIRMAQYTEVKDRLLELLVDTPAA